MGMHAPTSGKAKAQLKTAPWHQLMLPHLACLSCAGVRCGTSDNCCEPSSCSSGTGVCQTPCTLGGTDCPSTELCCQADPLAVPQCITQDGGSCLGWVRRSTVPVLHAVQLQLLRSMNIGVGIRIVHWPVAWLLLQVRRVVRRRQWLQVLPWQGLCPQLGLRRRLPVHMRALRLNRLQSDTGRVFMAPHLCSQQRHLE